MFRTLSNSISRTYFLSISLPFKTYIVWAVFGMPDLSKPEHLRRRDNYVRCSTKPILFSIVFHFFQLLEALYFNLYGIKT